MKKLSNSELYVMDVLWKEGSCTAKYISDVLNASIGWNINTTYTNIKRCIEKGAIRREDPNFLCHPIIAKEAVQLSEAEALIDRLYEGSVHQLFAALVNGHKLSKGELEDLRKMIDEMK